MSMFQKAVTAKRNVKMMLYGPSGSGKTWFGLSGKAALKKGQGVAYLGNEQGAAHYADVPELSGFHSLETRDLTKVEKAVKELATGQTPFGLLIVDTITDLYKLRQRKYERIGKDGRPAIALKDWGNIKREHDDLIRSVINLPMHVVIIAQEKPVYDKRGGDLIEVGVTLDSEKKDPYMFDVIGRLFIDNGTRFIGIDKDRTRKSQTGARIENPAFTLWADKKGTVQESVHVDREVTAVDLMIMIQSAKNEDERKVIFTDYKTYIDALDDDQKTELREAWKTAKEMEQENAKREAEAVA